MTIFDAAEIAQEGAVMGQVEIGISGYEGTPVVVGDSSALLKTEL